MRRPAAKALALVLLAAAAPARALEWVPLGGISALGGLHSFDGERGSFSGNVDADFAPAARLSPSWALLPSLRGAYEGTRRLNDVLGTATPAEQSLEARLGLRSIWSSPSSRWRLKPEAAYDFTWLRETRDEDWGKGLFDQRRWDLGFEAERLVGPQSSVRAGVEWFAAEFPNYTTLESQAALDFQGKPLSRELVGDHALDRQGWQFSLAGGAPLGARLILDGKAAVVWSAFPHQPLVDEGGQLEPDDRQDVFGDASVSVRMPHAWNADLRALGGLELGASVNSSNQNGYDAALGRFLPGFYDYVEWRAKPSATLIVGPERRPVSATLSVGWRRREYQHRPAQDESGAYSGGALATTEWTVGARLSYPMAERLSLLFDVERASAASNQRFQQFYRYSYQATTALAGVRWDW
ncbi:MAG: hypothetical protein KGM24_12425 [Elusimicrobia bacterium]|nr:hypothetical protein [Elusimicrobiota bacterium]